jgi:hypothetical protein
VNSSNADDEQVTSWRSVVPNTPVFSADGTQIGVAQAVLGWDQEDIFHGITIRDTSTTTDRLVPAARIGRLTTARIETDLSLDDVGALDAYTQDVSVPLQRTSNRLGVEETT